MAYMRLDERFGITLRPKFPGTACRIGDNDSFDAHVPIESHGRFGLGNSFYPAENLVNIELIRPDERENDGTFQAWMVDLQTDHVFVVGLKKKYDVSKFTIK